MGMEKTAVEKDEAIRKSLKKDFNTQPSICFALSFIEILFAHLSPQKKLKISKEEKMQTLIKNTLLKVNPGKSYHTGTVQYNEYAICMEQ